MAREMQHLGYSFLLRKVSGVDLCAKEAHYHDHCRKRFNSKYQTHKQYHHSKSTEAVDEQNYIYWVHTRAYGTVKELIQQKIILSQEVLPLTYFRDQYIAELKESGQYKPNYRATKLLERLKKDEDICEKLRFSKIESKGCIEFWLLYSSELSMESVISSTYSLASKDKLKDTAAYLREVIIKAYKNSAELPWPPRSEDVQRRIAEGLPEELSRFESWTKAVK